MRESDDRLVRKNIRAGLLVLGATLGMLALSFASVPLYRIFCQVTGFGGTPKIDPDAAITKVLDQKITIRFNADTAPDLPWIFRPEQPAMTLRIGQRGMASFYAKNSSGKPMEGTAIFNVLPEAAGQYFHKIQCFCFDAQTLGAGQEAHMPVVFFVDPSIVNDPDLKDLDAITLSYTFFPADQEGP